MTKRKIALSAVALFTFSVFCVLMSPSSASAYPYREVILRKSMYRAVTADCASNLPATLERDYILNGGLISVVSAGKALNKTAHPLPTNIDTKTAKPFSYTGKDTQPCSGIMYGLDGGNSTIFHRVLAVNVADKLKDPEFVREYLGYSNAKNGSNEEGEACVSYKINMEFLSRSDSNLVTKGTARTQTYCFTLESGKVKDLRREVTSGAKGIEDAYAPTAADYRITVGNGKIGLPSRSGDSINYTNFVGMTKENAINTLKGALQKWFNNLIDYRGGEGIGGSGAVACLAEGAGGSSGMLSSQYGAYCTYYKTVFDRYGISLTTKAPSEGYVFMSFKPFKNTLEVDSTKNNTTSNPNLVRGKDSLAIVKKLTKTDSDSQANINTYLTYSDKIMLYQHYLLGVYGIEVSCKEESKPEDGSGITFFNEGETKPGTNCRYIGRNTENKQQKNVKVNDVEAVKVGGQQMYQFSGTRIGVDDVIAFLKAIPEGTELEFPSDSSSDYYDTDVTDPDDIANTEKEKSKKSEEVSCYDTAGNSNWLVCPIIDNNKGATKMLYGFIEGMLQVNTKLFTQNDNGANGTLIAWESFRNIANVVFIIVFVIVILSQITGLGVDNYGIKKILPKLILGALLVNISYYICQACVDVANITGGGVKGILQSAADQMKGTKELKVQFDGIHAESIGIKATAASLIIGIAVAAVAVSGGSLLVPLVVGVVGVAIGLLFFATLLAVRQGLAVILVVISPMAFIAYMLPNTKTLFTKWVKVFSGVLLAYPICAFALYGGELTSNIILMAQAGTGGNAISNFPLALTSAIVSIAPVFFVPGLITKSMSGIAAASNRVQKGVSALAKGGTHRGLTPITEENAKRIKATRADNWMKKHKNDTHRTKLGDMYHRYRMRSGISKVSAYEGESAKIYEAEMKGMNAKSLTDMAGESFGENGKFDDVKFGAAIRQLNATGNDEVALEQIEEMSKNIDKMKPEDLEKFKSIVAQQGTLGKAYAKLLGKRQASPTPLPLLNFKDALNSGAEINGIMTDLGKNALAGMSKDEMSYLDTNYASAVSSGLFTEEQYTTAAAAHTGNAATKFLNLLNKSGRANAVRSGLSDTAFAGMDDKLRQDLFNGYHTEYQRRVDNLAQSGDKAVIASATGSLKADLDTEVASRAAAERVRAADAAKAAKDTVDVLNDIYGKM